MDRRCRILLPDLCLRVLLPALSELEPPVEAARHQPADRMGRRRLRLHRRLGRPVLGGGPLLAGAALEDAGGRLARARPCARRDPVHPVGRDELGPDERRLRQRLHRVDELLPTVPPRGDLLDGDARG